MMMSTFLQKSGYSKRFIESLPDLEELESKLNAYYALEKESKRSEMSDSPKRPILDSPSPTREQKARQAVAEAAASAGTQKWKMHIGPGVPGNSALQEETARTPSTPSTPQPLEKSVSVRKAMAMKEPLPKKPESPKKIKPLPPMPMPNKIPQGQVVLDKFGNFRLMTPPELKKLGEMGPLPPGRRPQNLQDDQDQTVDLQRDVVGLVPSTAGLDPRACPDLDLGATVVDHDRTTVVPGQDRAAIIPEAGHVPEVTLETVGGTGEGHNNLRGRGGGYYNNRDSRYGDRDYRGRGRPYPYNNRGGRRPRGRYQRGGYRDYRDRRYDRSHDRSRSRDRSRSFSGSRDSDDARPRRDSVEKEKVNKYADGEGESIRHEGPLSDGEDRDDYTSNDKVVDRDEFAGKWADKDEAGPSHRDVESNEDAEKSKSRREKKEDSDEKSKESKKIIDVMDTVKIDWKERDICGP
ncbi:hypothetical protein NQ317_013022 [Molorchus minor]|uniref:Uncharacterized protein n=1 Tax=Molorchus minor TaxID=1323400 RepID=A0ABQ9K333_9CUCU|nr:hypothetical protein NQ317_013022 [Molorchus minor]